MPEEQKTREEIAAAPNKIPLLKRAMDGLTDSPQLLLAISVVLFFAGILTIWMGSDASININALQPWQPLIATCVALVAAGLAYRGAIAKVDFDRETAEHIRVRRRQNISYRLWFELNGFKRRLSSIRQHVLVHAYESAGREMRYLEFARSRVISEVWENVEILDPNVTFMLGFLRIDLDEINDFIRTYRRQVTEVDQKLTDETKGILRSLSRADRRIELMSERLNQTDPLPWKRV
jgi:hypothetical protein